MKRYNIKSILNASSGVLDGVMKISCLFERVGKLQKIFNRTHITLEDLKKQDGSKGWDTIITGLLDVDAGNQNK